MHMWSIQVIAYSSRCLHDNTQTLTLSWLRTAGQGRMQIDLKPHLACIHTACDRLCRGMQGCVSL